MKSFRRFSRRAWPLHVWLMLSLLLWPVPTVRSYWTDSNQDGVKEWVDEAGLDPSWWDSDSDSDELTNAQEAVYGSDPYAKDSDRDGLSDLVERDYTPPSAPFDPWSWDTDGDGYSDHDEYYLLIQGSPLVVHYPSLGGIYYDYRDADGDGVLNYEDSDPVNMDRDGDGLRNWEDSWMDDAMNGYVPPAYDPGVYIGGTWYPSGTLDSDSDGIPDHLDPFAWGSFWYNGIEYGGSWADRDGDGIPDSADTYPDGSYWYNGVEYGGMWSDMDGDGVPDPADPSPVYVESYWYGGTEYLGIWQDSDSDGIPDPADAYMWDPWNGQPYYDYNGSQYPGESVDRDGDGVPDAADSWPDDPENGADDDNDGLSNYDERTQHFTDPHDVDSDNDWLTDYEELYVFQTNPKAPRSALASGQSKLDGQLHLGADADGDELPDVLEDYYASLGYGLDKNDPADGAGDLDSDGYTNAHAFTLGWSLIANRGTYDQDHDGIDDAVEAYWAAVYPGSMDKAVFEDAVADHDQDGLMNYEEVVRHNVNGWLLPADPGDPYSLMRSQGYEVVPGVTPNDGQFMRWWWDVDRADYGGTVDGTPVPADAALRDVTDMDPAPNGLPDGYERWVAANGEGSNTARAILADEDGDGMPNVWEHRHRLAPRDATDAVSPLGGVTLPPEPVMPDANDPLYYTDDGAGPQFVQAWYDTAMAEYEADVVERRLALALRPSYDPDGDALANLDEYLHGTHPRIADSDLDGFEDGAEVADGSDPTAFASIPPVRLRVVSGGGQSIATGLGAQRPLVVMVSQGGIPRSGAPITFACSDQRLLLNNGVNTITLLADEEGRATIAIAGAPAGTAGPATVQVTAPEVAAALSVSFTLNTTIPGGGGGGGPVPTPFSTPPPQYHLFTALRERRVSYSGHEIPSHPTDSQPIGSTTEWYKQQETTPRPAFSDDGFNGDADLQGDNEDPGDPRDDMASTGKYSEVPTTEGDPDAYSMENIAWATTNIGPFSGFKTTYGVYTANNAYPNPGAEDVKQAHVSAFFDHATAVSHLGDVAYQRGDASNGWQGNGPDGITSYQVMSTHTVNTSTLTISYLDDESGEALEDSAQVRSCSGRVEQAQVRLQTNTPVDTAHPARTLYNLLKRTIASSGETYTAQATIELSISSGQVSDTATVLSGTLPADVQVQNGVITMTSPATTQGVMTAWVLLPVDLAVDSNNDGTIDGADTAVEDVESGGSIDKMGHHLQINTFDYDADKVPDYIDGITKGGSLLASAGGNSIAGDPQRHFSKLKMTLGLSRSEYEFMFEYSADNPNNMSVNQGSNFGQKEQVGGAVENYNISAAGGSLRIWTKDADTIRKAESITASTAGDFVPANEWIAGDKMPTGDMFLEGVRPSTGWGSDKIKLKARSKTSTGTEFELDSVSFTVSKSVLRVYVNRPYTYEATATVKRPQLVIDYSTPRKANTSVFNAMLKPDPLPRPDTREDYNWYGHGFWCASYAGPGDSSIMTANAKEYWSGKTSAGNADKKTALKEGKVFWFAEPGLQHGKRPEVESYQAPTSPPIRTPHGEDMKIVAWHDFILPPKLLQKICTYPGRHDFSKYGLDIGATEGGCASYLGLTLKDAGMREHLEWEVRNHLSTTYSVSNEFPVVPIPWLDWMGAWSEAAVIELARDNFAAATGTDTWGGYTPAWQLNFYDPGLLAKWMDELRRIKKRTSTIYNTMPTAP